MVMKRSKYIAAATKLFNWVFIVAAISLGYCYGSFSEGCKGSEREALMQLKHELTDPSNQLASWNGDGDCCKWSRIVCSNLTSHVLELNLSTDYLLSGKISPSLINLKHLNYLDLSNNDFSGIKIPEFLGSMTSLKHLRLSRARFSGMIPHQLGNLSNLIYLDLQCDSSCGLSAGNLHWLSGLSSLQVLDLSYVNLNKTLNWLNNINTLHSLVELYLHNCQLPDDTHLLDSFNLSSLSILYLNSNFRIPHRFPSWIFHLKTLTCIYLADNQIQGPIPNDLQNLTSLRELYLYSNYLNSSIPIWFNGFSHLEFLDLNNNEFQGDISNSIGNMTSLVSLDLSFNDQLELVGGIPVSFKNFCNLRSLRLFDVKLNQSISEIFKILSACGSDELKSLALGSCQLFGHLPDRLGLFKNLLLLNLESNTISGSIPTSVGELKSLDTLILSNNKLNGTLPISFGELNNLEWSDISYNLMNGDVSEIHFANLTKLGSFRASDKRLTLRVGPDWVPPFQLADEIELRSWNLGPEFPTWLQPLRNLNLLHLDVSNSGISSTIPVWFWNLFNRIDYLNISHNQIHGVIPKEANVSRISDDALIDFSSNLLVGELPYIFSDAATLDFSNNSFSGSISNFLCSSETLKLEKLQFLKVERNYFSGKISDCWKKWQNLKVINLSYNKFNGEIPSSMGSLSLLRSLHLRNNHLSGEIPLSLQNCTQLVTLDFAENELVGNIPTWIGDKLSTMVIINFRSNKFSGYIPEELCYLNFLQMLDLADNNLSGTLPSCISNFSAMVTRDDPENKIYTFFGGGQSFTDDVLLVMQGRAVGYSTILKLVRSIDISCNNFSGKIPGEIGSLKALRSINFSHNHFSGKIPDDIDLMELLEIIDLSKNQFSGEIPQSLASLKLLNFLNLSYNNLSGIIPLGTQIQSFSPSSFMGNNYLCGAPLAQKCSVGGESPGIENGNRDGDQNGSEVYWFYATVALGFIVGFWSVLGPLCFVRRWRHVYFNFLDYIWHNFFFFKLWS